ncbi:Helix-turn-helix domain-containing protein [Paenibacillus sp. UNCCL117]|uniref:helix-turn-helix domain-containing protein n=1 Tax=unclassified Paenibacillus TaxID=185978 RepID=UPI0008883686|nr:MULTISPECIES: helix-turn-helix domain-containing protein [unclassified Paenibacillus]SDE45015.1 Helix-turn-helix domain-containing protein [Paenibacillus sp. cl123]SFW46416.1 Helix-turn-helix domain-containing protein [Paenibacillus sp. UNCCL117]
MKTLQPITFIKNRSNSLFIRLLAGFLCIVVLLASLTVYAISVSKQNIRKEVEKYNTLMLETTRDSYEKHFELIKKQMFLFLFNDDVQRYQRSPNSAILPTIVKDISTWVANPFLFIDNIVFHSKPDGLIIERGTSTNADSMFGVFYASKEYPLEFWKRQFDETYAVRIFPATAITNYTNRLSPQELGDKLPIIFRNSNSPNIYMAVFLDLDKMYQAFHQSLYDDFIVYDDQGQTIYKSANREPFLSYEELRANENGDAFIRDEKYYFVKQGQGTGFSYVYRVPVEQIASQTRLNITLIGAVVAAITLSIVFAFLFSAQINNPLKKMIESIRHRNDKAPHRSSIKEFNIISDEIHVNQLIRQQLSFINRLKAIRSNDQDSINLDFTNKTFVFVLYQIKPFQTDESMQALFQKWLYYIKTFIDSKLNPAYPDSLTFQMERDQILSLIFIRERAELDELLLQMKHVLDHDREYGIVTIAVSSAYTDSSDLTAAYEEVQDLVGERQLINETQIITERAAKQTAVGFSPDQDKEFEANLKEGNAAQLTALMERLFTRWHGKNLTAAMLQRFAESFVGKIRSATLPFQVEPERLEVILEGAEEKIQRCNTAQELEELLLGWVTATAEAVQDKKEEKYPVTTFVMEYINEHLTEEIYLDVLAEKLKMSSGYLSTYFKSKTGKNIVDYINETRIEKATELLGDSRIKIHDAAKAVGYQNITSFNRMFKKYKGLTPSEYRKRLDS